MAAGEEEPTPVWATAVVLLSLVGPLVLLALVLALAACMLLYGLMQ